TLADGSTAPIRELVETNLDDPDPVDDGVYDDADILVSSLASDGELTERTATRVWKREAPERLIRVRTASGREIEVTPSHPLFVSADGTFEPRRADELDRGSFVATPQYRPSGHDNELRAEYRRLESGNAVHIDAPDEWTPWFARFLGYVVAEGYVEQNPDNTGSIFVTNNDQAVLDDVSDALEKLNAPHSVRSPHEDREAREIVCTAGELVSLLENIEPAVLRPSAEQRVPDQLFETGNDVRRAFLRAYVEGEGHVSTRQRSLTVGSMSRELLEGVRSLLLSFGVGSTLESRQNGSYRLRISGESFVRFRERIGLVSERKREALRRHEGVETNTNVDVIPNVGQELERIRSQLGLSQSECGVPRATYQHYERGDRQPSLEGLTAVIEAFEERLEWLDEVRDRLVKCDWDVLEDVRSELNVSQGEVAAATGVTQGSISGYERGDVSPDGGVTDEARQALLGVVDEAASVEEDVQSLRRLVEADVRWDEVVSLEWVEHDEDWVYDLEVTETHSYVSDGVVSHNSQLLSYTQNIAPRSVYTSGKGSSAAGLCVTGDTLVHTADGIRRADDLVTPEIPESVETETAVEREYDVYTYDEAAGETTVASTSHVWRMPPKPCRRIETASGTELETSQNTPVLTCGDDGLEWKSMSEVEAGDHVATPTFDGIERSSPPVSEFVEYTNEKLLLTDDSVECLRDSLTEKFGTLRDAAAALDFSEDFVYDTLSNRHVPVEKLDRIVSETPTDWGDIDARRAMLRHGEGVEIPTEFDADLMYLLGLTYGDGDIAVSRRDENRGMVRISNSDEALLRRAVDIIESVFDKEVEIERQEDRVACIRLHSATIARLFHNVGMSTPKTGLSLDDRLTTAEHADAFLRGLMDADGSVSKRDDGGSSVHFSTISERLARQVRAMLHTYDVQARIRERDRRGTSTLPDGHTIESKHVQYHVEVYGSDLDRYAECVGFGSETKRAVLDRITGETPRRGERLPVGSQLAAADVPVAGSYHNVVVRGYDPSRERAISMQQELDLGEAASLVESVTGSNLRWDEVVAAVDTGRKELYDLTVPGTNNFVADGVITHNTAAAVRDDFGDGQQWTLEAGALVL
ncbi:MAG: LAGLIDADG family homing endonuclease, partial [Halobaculum sp.]